MIRGIKMPMSMFNRLKEKAQGIIQTFTKENSTISKDFSPEFLEKLESNRITMNDLATLSSKQLEILQEKKFLFYSIIDYELIEKFSLKEIVEFYCESKEEFEAIQEILKNRYEYQKDNYEINSFDFNESIKVSSSLKEVKELCFEYAKEYIITGNGPIIIQEFPELFIKENKGLFLLDVEGHEELKEKYYHRKLTLDDLIKNKDLFLNIPISYFIKSDHSIFLRDFIGELGSNNFLNILEKYPDFIKRLLEKESYILFRVTENMKNLNEETSEDKFFYAMKKYFEEDDIRMLELELQSLRYYENYQSEYLKWVTSIFEIVIRINTAEELVNFDEKTNILLSQDQRKVIQMIGIENLKRLQNETRFFSRVDFSDFVLGINDSGISVHSYEDFYLKLVTSYTWRKDLQYEKYSSKEFREKHPEFFLDENAPDPLKKEYYSGTIHYHTLWDHPEYIPFLKEKDIHSTLLCPNYNADLYIISHPSDSNNTTRVWNFFDVSYIRQYGKEEFLSLICKYGPLLENLQLTLTAQEFNNKKILDKKIRDEIYRQILEKRFVYNYELLEKVPEFIEEHNDIFINLDHLNIPEEEKYRLKVAFYQGNFTFDDIRKYPKLISILKDKNLKFAFHTKVTEESYNRDVDMKLLELGSEKFLELASTYGRYLDGCMKNIILPSENFENLKRQIESAIIDGCYRGRVNYQEEDAPEFIRRKCPDLFLDEDTPKNLREYFYNTGSHMPLTFEVLSQNPDWLPFLKGKAIGASLLRRAHGREELTYFLDLFEEKAISLGISRTETVTKMLESEESVYLMKQWYDKTGRRFIPDFVIMKNITLERFDEFKDSGWLWGRLMKMEDFARNPDSRESMLKIAYSLGAFEQGTSKKQKEDGVWRFLREVFTEVPKVIDQEFMNNLSYQCLGDDRYLVQENYEALTNALQEEGLFLEEDALKTLYHKNEDGSYSLRINPQSYPKTSEELHKLLNYFTGVSILTPYKAKKYFSDFEMRFDPEFRDFFIRNYRQIISNERYLQNIALIQRNFEEIKKAYKRNNTTQLLSIEFACDQVEKIRFKNIEVGNEQAAFAVSKVQTDLDNGRKRYEQTEWEMLQEIYNQGKIRVFSSIPRVESESGKYSYEILRLEDYLTLIAGDLTTCCQHLGGAGSTCMEHAMQSKHGRIFIVRENGVIVAQSWVWRNKNVLCFDNIEVPDKQMWDHGTPRGQEENIRNEFTDEILAIYQKAAEELIQEDEKVLRQLKEEGKITEEQYESLRLRKVTTGKGYSNIKGSLVTLEKDEHIARPIHLDEGYLYTHDSEVQYVLTERDTKTPEHYHGDTLTVFHDTYEEYDEKTFSMQQLITLKNLELVTKKETQDFKIYTSEAQDSKELFQELAMEYGMNPENIKVILHPNFSIIYEKKENEVKIADLFFNKKIIIYGENQDITNTVALQILLALEQISEGKDFDITMLNENQRKMYEKALALKDTEILDEERGIKHAR